jgi:hypothetical protein
MLTYTTFESALEQILDITKRFAAALNAAGIPYRVVGGFAVFQQVDQRDPLAARLTRDVDVAVSRSQIEAIQSAVTPYGFVFRRAAGVDMFVDAANPSARSAVHVIFIGEFVRPGDLETVPSSPPDRTQEGICIAPVVDLLHMKLTSFRLKDKVHIQDMDSVGLITPEIEATLSPEYARRLSEVRASE